MGSSVALATVSEEARRVLIIEDNDLNLKLFKDLLEAHGYQTIETKDGARALDLIIEASPDLVLLDIQLPNVSGIDIIKQIRGNEQTKEIPVIAVTAFAMHDDEERIIDAGCQAYVSKPISIISFVELIQKYLAD